MANTDTIGLRAQLTQICLEAIESHWDIIEPYMKDIAFDIVRESKVGSLPTR